MNRGRCTQHGLAIGPDGGCVLCRRETGSGAPPSGSRPSNPAPSIRAAEHDAAPGVPSSPSSSSRMSWTTPAAPASPPSSGTPSSKDARQTGRGPAWVAPSGRSSGSHAAVRPEPAPPGPTPQDQELPPALRVGAAAQEGPSSQTPSARPRSSTPPPKQGLVSVLPGDDGDAVVVRVPRGVVAACIAIVAAAGAFAWSRVTPDLSVVTKLFPAPPVQSEEPVAPESPAVSGQATEQVEPQRAVESTAPVAPAREQVPSVEKNDDPAAVARRLQNQIEEKKERLAHARRNVTVTMYSTSWCKVCKDARSYLKETGTAFEDYDVDADRDADQRLRAINARHTVPTFDIDGAVLTGWSPGAFESMLTSAAAKRAERE